MQEAITEVFSEFSRDKRGDQVGSSGPSAHSAPSPSLKIKTLRDSSSSTPFSHPTTSTIPTLKILVKQKKSSETEESQVKRQKKNSASLPTLPISSPAISLSSDEVPLILRGPRRVLKSPPPLPDKTSSSLVIYSSTEGQVPLHRILVFLTLLFQFFLLLPLPFPKNLSR